MGNFNYVLHDEERSSNKGTSSSFQKWVVGRGLLDIGLWVVTILRSHGASLETKRSARLDRAICCDEWRGMFPSATI